ncbi:MAG: endonuclease/exonuclease/phosphatase family metal-dependent hydrolase [Rhodothermales bacterium]|jgi:endonuclease/exonuclease/phosphatase family metal-dependent hydrolase
MTRSFQILFILAGCTLGYSCSTSDRTSKSAAPTQLSVLTFNIRYDNPNDGDDAWPNRADWVTDTIEDLNPDVFGLQEALLHQIEHIAHRLPDYSWIGVGRDDGLERGEYSPLFYRRDTMELLTSETWWLSRTPADTGSIGWDAALPRVATAARMALRDADGPRELTVVNTHFDHRGEMARTQSAALLADSLRDRPRVILMGDFNFVDTSDGYDQVVGSGLVDSFKQSGEPQPVETFTGFDAVAGPSGDRIDMIFSRGADILSYEALNEVRSGHYVSDHRPVVARVSFAN